MANVQRVEFAIKQHAFAASWHVVLGKISLEVTLHPAIVNKHIARELRPRFEFVGIEVGKLVVLQLGDRFRENLQSGQTRPD